MVYLVFYDVFPFDLWTVSYSVSGVFEVANQAEDFFRKETNEMNNRIITEIVWISRSLLLVD